MIALEGLIGAGKSEVLRELARRGFSVKLENTDSWTLLNQFYASTAYAFALQVQILASYAHVDYTRVAISERSPDSALGIFAASLPMSAEQRKALETLETLLPLQRPTRFVYIDVPVDVCLRRIKQRGRQCEANIDISYLQALRTAHVSFFKNYDVVHLILDGSETIQQVADQVQSYL